MLQARRNRTRADPSRQRRSCPDASRYKLQRSTDLPQLSAKKRSSSAGGANAVVEEALLTLRRQLEQVPILLHVAYGDKTRPAAFSPSSKATESSISRNVAIWSSFSIMRLPLLLLNGRPELLFRRMPPRLGCSTFPLLNVFGTSSRRGHAPGVRPRCGRRPAVPASRLRGGSPIGARVRTARATSY